MEPISTSQADSRYCQDPFGAIRMARGDRYYCRLLDLTPCAVRSRPPSVEQVALLRCLHQCPVKLFVHDEYGLGVRCAPCWLSKVTRQSSSKAGHDTITMVATATINRYAMLYYYIPVRGQQSDGCSCFGGGYGNPWSKQPRTAV